MSLPRYLLLFDIDGTLIRSNSVGRGAMQSAAARLFGDAFSFQGVEFAGNLDPLIFAEAAARCQLDEHDDHHERFRSAYMAELAETLRESTHVRAIDGVLSLLDRLRSMPQVVLGLLSGNYAQAAPLKLAAAGIRFDDFRITAFGDEGAARCDLVVLAMQRFEKQIGHAAQPRRVMVIGDTPRDVAAAKAHDCFALAVATGDHSVQQLRDSGADLVLNDFLDPAPLLAILQA